MIGTRYSLPPCRCVRVPCRRAIAPCLPTSAPRPPSGDGWLHEIKHDGFRVIARKNGQRVTLYSRPGNDLTPAVKREAEEDWGR
jgi:bifunctional non-homologous end joining protein LigD